MRRWLTVLNRVVAPASVLVLLGSAFAGATPGDAEVRTQLAGLRMPFIANQGQVDGNVAYYAPTFAGTLFVTARGELVYALPSRASGVSQGKPRTSLGPGWSLSEILLGGQARPVAHDPSATGVSYFVGHDPARWRPHVPSFERVSLGEVWPGVGVALRARGSGVEKTFTVAPGASVDRIRIRVGGADALAVAPEGALVARTGRGEVTFTAPVAYQERDGVRRPVPVAYRIQGAEYGFTVAEYDQSLPLVIDPLLRSTYLGGTAEDEANALVIHPTTGDIYVAGLTISTDFPGTVGGAQATSGGAADAFVARLTAGLTTLTQVTYLGGSNNDFATTLAIHPTTGDVYVAGYTNSTDFPGTTGGAQPLIGGSGGVDAFVARLPASLTALTQATYLGGSGLDQAQALAVHPTTGDIYVAGYTTSANFPGTTGGAQALPGGGQDAFVARLNNTLTALTQATYLGGTNNDVANALVVTPTTVYVAGWTASSDFPGTAGGARPTFSGLQDAFIARLPSGLTALTQTTYLGGSDLDQALALAVHPMTADVYVAGVTASTDFPMTTSGAQDTAGGGQDAFVARVNSALTSLIQATYLGGISNDVAYALVIAPTTGDIYVAGYTQSVNFPGTSGGTQSSLRGPQDAFVARVSTGLGSLIQATYLGGSSSDYGDALAMHPTTGDLYVAGGTVSTDFPGTVGAAQPAYGGGPQDAFVSRLTFSLAQGSDRDFNGDGKSDILWRDTSGNLAMWLMNGVSVLSSGVLMNVPAVWQPVGMAPPGFVGPQFRDLADFNGDGKADILWWNSSSGDLALWLMNGLAILGNNFVTNESTAWTPVRVGDFNGDGKADILWRNTTTGDLAMWLMNGTTIVSNTLIGNVSTAWTPVRVGDFNGDGKADIVWRNTSTGDVAIWLMNGTTIASSGFIMTVPTTWQPVGVGDFNGDGRTDFLWWNSTTGDLAMWLMNGLTIGLNSFLGNVPTVWTPVRVDDLDGDGKADILWRNTTSGDLAVWFMNGPSLVNNTFITNVPTVWTTQ